jgi:hypothetical protein
MLAVPEMQWVCLPDFTDILRKVRNRKKRPACREVVTIAPTNVLGEIFQGENIHKTLFIAGFRMPCLPGKPRLRSRAEVLPR